MSNGKFEVYQDLDGKYRFCLRAPNKKIIAVGQGYTTKTGCIRGIEAVKRYASAEIVDLTSPQLPPQQPEDISAEILERAKVLGVASTYLHLDDPAPEYTRVPKGTQVVFRGRLTSGSSGIPGEPIIVCEHDRSFISDDYIATGTTDKDGVFEIPWKAREMDWWDNSVEVYSKYEGSKTYLPARSNIYTLYVA